MAFSTSSSTPPRDPLPSQLLHYLPDHKALICATCHYAIQPSAISRHLKDIHQIHRARRRPFMSYVSTLELAPPEQVISLQTKLNVFPVPGLPVVEGLMCGYEKCEHLCASTKRMKSHWLAVHDVAGRAGLDWKAVRLQTFFRGNLLKYFTDGLAFNGGATTVVDEHVADEMIYEYDTIISEDVTISRTTSPTLDTSDAGLLKHFITNTASTLSTNHTTTLLWQTTIPILAKSHLFLHHGILSCSALHLAHLHPSSPMRSKLTLLASHHQDIAMPLFRQMMTSVTPQNCDAVLAFAHLLVIISFAIDTQALNSNSDDQLMIVSPPALPMPITTVNGNTNAQDGDSILPPWLYLLRSGCSILCDIWDFLELGPVSVLAAQWDMPVQVPDGTPPPLLPHLLSLIPSSSCLIPFSNSKSDQSSRSAQKTWTEHEITTYISSARSLDLAFRYRAILGTEFSTWDALRVWPISISEDYLNLLAKRHEGALVLLGFYCVLLKMVEIRWYFEGRAQRLLRAVLACLDETENAAKWRSALCWAITEVGIDEIHESVAS
ncbi:hypothetical protein BKA65DRAFT_486930 [Rhexocercosporidium sp. MPI-PUGE-AT-0058]|nr:hypothetical protein BKA65DRAFT_486930 [Rhexocercosporidium sp. MPI-PUGE-AT-0058]